MCDCDEFDELERQVLLLRDELRETREKLFAALIKRETKVRPEGCSNAVDPDGFGWTTL